MCTVSILPTGSSEYPAIRLACNRDELRTRPDALPPQRRRFGARDAILPIDPSSGGTWISASDAGFVMVLLNQRPLSSSNRSGISSRGLIIPSLLHTPDRAAATEIASRIDAGQFAPFRLLIVGTNALTEVASDGCALRVRREEIGRVPLMFTSSGLGDHLVQQPRQELFERMLGHPRATPAMQDAFHSHCWPDRLHLSVNMSRADARTVSHTTIELSRARATMHYHVLESDGLQRGFAAEVAVSATLPARPAIAATVVR